MTTLTNNKTKNIEIVKRVAKETFPEQRVLEHLSVCQAILESDLRESIAKNKGKGGSELALKYCNLFGIKGSGNKGKVPLKSGEYIDGKYVVPVSDFAYNDSVEASFSQYKRLLENGTKDNKNRYQDVIKAKTVPSAAEALVKGGYATDPSYVKKIVSIYVQFFRG